MISRRAMQFGRYVSIVAVASFLLSGCGGSSSDEGQNTDPRDGDETAIPTPVVTVAPSPTPAPTGLPVNPVDSFNVSAVQPASGATERALVSTITINFNKPLVAATAISSNVALKNGNIDLAFELRYQDGSALMELRPAARLEPYLSYTVELGNGLMSEDGESLTALSWQFTTTGNLGETTQEVIDSCMSEVDIEMLDAVNNVRAQGYTCIDRFYPSTYPLRWNCQVAAAAERHSRDMATNDVFSHTGSDGSAPSDRIAEAGYSWAGWAENIAAGQGSVDEVMEGWLTSPTGHCQNVMNGELAEFGSSLVIPDQNSSARYRSYWTQNFALKRN